MLAWRCLHKFLLISCNKPANNIPILHKGVFDKLPQATGPEMVKVSKTHKSESSYAITPLLKINCMGNSWPNLAPKKGKGFSVQYSMSYIQHPSQGLKAMKKWSW